jgi:hypothetical protein
LSSDSNSLPDHSAVRANAEEFLTHLGSHVDISTWSG